ncbi:MAG: hypothetical protein K6F99_09080 [Lachnospiraceae bacterium]|nr:hypothetical protein [Lachnospiraceae bacterium]
MWHDHKHFTYEDSVYDLEQNTLRPVFPEADLHSNGMKNTKLDNGEVLSITLSETFLEADERSYDLMWRLEDGDIQSVKLPDREYDINTLVTASNGLCCLRSAKKGEDDKISDSYILCDTVTGHVSEIKDECPGNISRALYISSGHIASVDDDNNIRVYDTSDGKLVLTLPSPDENIACIAFTPDDKLMMIHTKDTMLRLYSVTDGTLLYEEITEFYYQGAVIKAIENPSLSRLYIFCPKIKDGKNGICLDAQAFKKTSDLYGMAGFVYETNEIYCHHSETTLIEGKSLQFIRYPAYTLDELINLGKQHLSQ